jgi:two-component system alkaline phosphatase synthesis response regulator PhoP
MAEKILVIEDESDMGELLVDNLEAEGYLVAWAQDGREGERLWYEFSPHAVILDVMLPHRNGFALCQMMREAGSRTPILFLSAKGQPEARVQGLASGGDDYLCKPFHLPELLLRLRNLLQRSAWAKAESAPVSLPIPVSLTQIGTHKINQETGDVTLSDGRLLRLREEELKLIRFLLQHPKTILDRDTLLDGVFSEESLPSSRVLEGYFHRLRQIFEKEATTPRRFHSLRGMRFFFSPEGQDDPFAGLHPRNIEEITAPLPHAKEEKERS